MGIVASPAESVRADLEPWQQALRSAIRDPRELCRVLGLPEELARSAGPGGEAFAVLAPLAYVAKMEVGNPHDPLLRQVLPLAAELDSPTGFLPDPVGDLAARRTTSLLQKYSGRVLLVTTGACAIHCRYCFRRHYPYQDGGGWSARVTSAIDEISQDPTLEEVILSGGDPLTLGDDRLAELAARLAAIPHLTRWRFHTRLPIVIPERVTESLLQVLRGCRLTPIWVVHANHPREIDTAVTASLGRLVDAGIPVLNQAVLLRGVNDDPATLAELSRRLIAARVIPYYLHQLDRVAGAAHFEVPESDGLEIVEALRRQLPGYAVPRYVRETPGDAGKSWL